MAYAGFNKLRLGRIHLYCPACGRKMSNMLRDEHDPKSAVLMHIFCLRCSEGCKETPSYFFNARGQQVQQAEW